MDSVHQMPNTSSDKHDPEKQTSQKHTLPETNSEGKSLKMDGWNMLEYMSE